MSRICIAIIANLKNTSPCMYCNVPITADEMVHDLDQLNSMKPVSLLITLAICKTLNHLMFYRTI